MYKKKFFELFVYSEDFHILNEPMVTTHHKYPAKPLQVKMTKVIVKIKVKAAHSSVNSSQIYTKEVSKIDLIIL